MTKWLATFGFICLALFGQAQEKVINDKGAQSRQVPHFEGISVSGAIELYVSQGPQAVAVSAPEDVDINELETYVKDDILYIRYKTKKSWWSDQWNTTGRNYRAYVSAETIRSLSSSGSGNIHIEGTIKTPELELEISGSGNLAGAVQVEKLEVNQSGSSNIKLSGSAEKADFECAGSGNIQSPELSIDDCEVSISGSGNAEITVNRELSASISGSGNIRYRGNGNLVNVNTAGSGRVKKI